MIPQSTEPVPGFMVFVHYVNGDVVLQQEVPKGEHTEDAEHRVRASATFASEMTDRYIAAGHPVTLHVYDGDTGALVSTAIADSHGKRRLS